MTDHEIGLLLTENRAFVERIAWYSVGLVHLLAETDHQKRVTSDVLGTGTLCRWKDYRIVLTANHVVAKAKPSELAFLLRVDDALKWEGTGQDEEVISRVTLPVEDIVRCKEKDLAAIVLKAKELSAFKMQFCELPKSLAKNRTPKSEGSLVLLGYPVDQKELYTQVNVAGALANYFYLRPIILAGTLAGTPTKALSSRYDPERDVLVNYTPADPTMKPHGFSGAAAWSERNERSGGLWTADPVLFGVQTDAFMTSKLLLVVGAPAVREFLEEWF
jgi:hypothetical protein